MNLVTSRRSRNPEHGGSGTKLVLLLLLLCAMVFAGFKILPIYVDNYQVQDAIQSEARFAIGNRPGPKEIRDDLWKKIKEIGIPVQQEDIMIDANQGRRQNLAGLLDSSRLCTSINSPSIFMTTRTTVSI